MCDVRKEKGFRINKACCEKGWEKCKFVSLPGRVAKVVLLI